MEKRQATPEAYPLTLHALRAACNQTTNREPVTTLSDEQIAAALERLREIVLVWKSEGARAEKWEENLSSKLSLAAPERALVTLLLLRGPQTPGELRARAERLHPFLGITDLERALERLGEGLDPLAAELPRRPGQKETRWRELLSVPDAELPATAPRAAEAPASDRHGRLEAIEARVTALESALAELKARLGG
jgi:uncharacterized protein YceH (UPF0502 family)